MKRGRISFRAQGFEDETGTYLVSGARLWGHASPRPDLDILDGPGGNVIDTWELKGLTTSRIDTVTERLKDAFQKKFNGRGGKCILDMRKSPLSNDEVLKGMDDAFRKGYMGHDDYVWLKTKDTNAIVHYPKKS